MKKIGKFIDLILAILLSNIFVYILVTFVRSFLQKSSMFDLILDFKNNLQFILELPQQLSIAIFVLPLIIGIFIFILMNQKPKGYTDASSHGAYGSAKFTNLEELRKEGYISNEKKSKLSEKDPYVTLSVEQGIILGRVKNELVIIPEDSRLNNRNLLLVGASGSGKGQSFVINNIINNRKSTIIVTDPKGELYNLTHEIKRDQGYRVYQIDFLNLKGDGFNPLDYVYDDLDAKRVAETIARNASKDDKEDHWFSKAVELLTGLILYVKDKYDSPSISVEVFREFSKIYEEEDYLLNICEEIGQEHIAYQYLKSASVAKGNERASILSTFTNKVGVFSSIKVKNLTKNSDINFHELQEELSIVYIKMPIKDNPFQSLTATFFDQMINTLYKIGDQYGSILKIPTMFLLDEFANIGKINDYDNVLSTCRGYGMSMITIVQDFAQLEKMYGKEVTRTIISNHDTLLFLKTSDVETAKYLEQLADDTTIRYTTSSKNKGGGLLYYLDVVKSSPSHSENEQFVKKALVSAGEFIRIKPNEAYAFISGKLLKLEKAYQGVIYKDFITGSAKEVDENGIPRFPYVYPKNREEYIKRFNLTPYEMHLNNVVSNSNELPVLEVPSEEKNHTEQKIKKNDELVKQQINKNDDKMLDNLISDFIKKVKKSEEKQEKEIEDDENKQETSNEPIEQNELLEKAVEESKVAFDEEPSQAALEELKEIITFKQVVEEINVGLEEVATLESMANFFEYKPPKIESINNENESEESEGIINIEDEIEEELPM